MESIEYEARKINTKARLSDALTALKAFNYDETSWSFTNDFPTWAQLRSKDNQAADTLLAASKEIWNSPSDGKAARKALRTALADAAETLMN